MLKPTLSYDDLLGRSQRKYADAHGEQAMPVLMHHAVEGALRAYESSDGREDFLARVGVAKAQFGPRDGEQGIVSQEVIDVVAAVKSTAEECLISWN